MQYRTALFRLEMVFMTIFALTLLGLDHYPYAIQLKLANIICAILLSILITKQLYNKRAEFMDAFNDFPWASGAVFIFAFVAFFSAFDPHKYTELTDYSFSIMVVPIALVGMYITGYGRMLYIDKKNAESKNTKAMKQGGEATAQPETA
jgi:FlaA1/EpsC-like NDP-sugar epimerase